ncbi:cyclic nucleotide-binding domain-containing protein [Oscillatoriales cyanobacterium LEGE 11467]|uniref:Cyclic nucleotide-binding domain-containing protein n=1 Tax=Zarconia navalis LEGE 11467 TaxID=1828826 RepID=A0A928W0C5_9CYAN|nr:cyclic nucleotide-binding domain-containing protein [Zarconia navalis]MBE9041626.1 cyclic nucleotide-binding domain-containing protein [Zarconia navalis LEGE 11467]
MTVKTGRRFVQYGYVGLVIGYFVYYGLYAGNLDYYFSGAWTHEETQIAKLLNPGFYLFNRPISIPKLVAVPLTLSFFVLLCYATGNRLESIYRGYLKHHDRDFNPEKVLHRCFSIATFLAFNLFFIYGGRPEILRWSESAQWLFNAAIAMVSTLWLYRNWNRSWEQYQRESDAEKLRRQLKKLPLNFPQILDGKSIDDLTPEAVYILAKTLPGITQQDRLQIYRGILKEAIAEGRTNTATSLEVFEQMRQHLGIADDEHYTTIAELGIEDPDLLDSRGQHSREEQLRLESYCEALSYLLMECIDRGIPYHRAIELKSRQVRMLQQAYRITGNEHDRILTQLFDRDSDLRTHAEALLSQLQVYTCRHQALTHSVPNPHAAAFVLLRSLVVPVQQRLTTQLLGILEIIGEEDDAISLAKRVGLLAGNLLPQILQDQTAHWRSRLSPHLVEVLVPNWKIEENPRLSTQLGRPMRSDVAIDVLEDLIGEPNTIVRALGLYALHQLKPEGGRQQAKHLLSQGISDELSIETANKILQPRSPLTTLEQMLRLVKTGRFDGLKPPLLMALVRVATLRTYQADEVLYHWEESAAQISILIRGKAEIQSVDDLQAKSIGTIVPGQIIGTDWGQTREREVAKAVAVMDGTEVLAISTADFDRLLHQHPPLAQIFLMQLRWGQREDAVMG